MGVPSVVKIKKGNVEYTSKVDIAQYTIQELTRRALLDVGRYVTYNVRKNVQAIFPFTGVIVKKHRASERYQYWVLKKENELLLGVENRKKGAKTAWWADQLELDSFVIPPRGSPKGAAKKQDDAKARKAKKRGKGKSSGLGTANMPRRHLLEKFVKTHIDKIVEIESQYLKTINNESAAVALARATEEMEVLRGDES